MDSLDFPKTIDAKESRVLVIYTGGTIGMLHGSQGYTPLPGYLLENLRSQPRFHDPGSTSLCANSRSVEDFRSWQSYFSITSPPKTPMDNNGSSKERGGSSESTLLSTKDDFHSSNRLKVITPKGPEWFDSLLMPENFETPQIRYVVYEFERLIDSSEIETSDYLDICNSIQSNYHLFDSFVILHGTDTMAYTASALSFLLENLGKSVILTGAQIPLSCPRNDAVDNLLGALQISGTYLIPEVSLYFNHRLWRGNRTIKVSSVEFDAFKSFNLEPLVKVGCSVEVQWDLISKPVERKAFKVHKSMCENVAVLRLFPGITPASVRAFLASPIKGIALETFGAGNAPRKPEFLKAFSEASARGVIIVNVTQCFQGTVSDETYATGRALARAGIISGRDMTTECALAKLGYLLSKPGLSLDVIRRLISQPLRGELTLPAQAQFEPVGVEETLKKMMKQMISLNLPDHSAINSSPMHGSGLLKSTDFNLSTAKGSTIGRRRSFTTLSSTNSSPQPNTVNNSYADVGVDFATSEILQTEYERLHRTLLPLSLVSASSRGDSSLQQLMDSHLPAIQANGLLNHRTSAGLGQTALHLAAFFGRLENIELLLDNGASVHIRDDCGHTPLYYAMINDHRSCMKALKIAGAHLADHERISEDTTSPKSNSSFDSTVSSAERDEFISKLNSLSALGS
ncbi:L-asparaginase [Phakopsora pachyrhizi]|uniref:asparaginase n=1 Tax=Phakopsora pachyrhizi TaxID=170000 RepID=A0AAV0BGX6_PHAPC|nr:L-asparaginase [Phakopsora pachyrhizi]